MTVMIQTLRECPWLIRRFCERLSNDWMSRCDKIAFRAIEYVVAVGNGEKTAAVAMKPNLSTDVDTARLASCPSPSHSRRQVQAESVHNGRA